MSQSNPSKLGTAVVTGASSGIGKVYADRLAARGYDLLLVARRADRLEAIGADLEARHPVRVRSLVADLASPTGLQEAVQAVSSDASITMLVNNAGIASVGPLAATSPEKLTSMVALNIVALSALTMAVLPRFQEQNAGTIINIGSVVGFAPYELVPIYGPTKAYVMNFTQVLQQQLAKTGIRVQLVAPSGTISEIWDSFGMPISSIDPGLLMTTENCVDAALNGLDRGELITAPSVEDESLVRSFETASMNLLQATQTSQPASRYGLRG